MANITFGGPIRAKVGGLGIDIMDGAEPIIQKRWRKTTVTTAQVLALFATPIEVLPAVGSTNYLQFNGAYVYQDFNATAYNDDGTNEDPVIQLGGGGANVSGTVDSTLIDGGADFLIWLPPAEDITAATIDGVTNLVTNSSLEIALDGSEVITGDSAWDVVVLYTLFPQTGLNALS